MAYVGNTPADKTLKLEKQQFTTSATTSYTLSHSVSDPQDIALFINNVRQNPNSSYTVSGTALTLSAATASTDTMYCVFLGRAIGTVGIGAGSVTKDKVDFISDGTGSGVISKGDGSSIDGSIQLNCHVNSHGIKLKSPPHSAGQSYTLTFPQTAPSSGKFIQTDGSGNLSFASAGTHVLLQSTNITSNVIEVDFDNTISDTYTNYMVVGRGIKKDTQNAIRFQYKNGSSALTSTYDWAYGHGARTRNSTAWYNKDTGTAYLQMQEDCGTQTTSFTSFIDSSGRTSGSHYCPFYGTITNWTGNSSGQVVATHTGVYVGSTTIDGFKIFCQSGNFTAGRISLYGVSHA